MCSPTKQLSHHQHIAAGPFPALVTAGYSGWRFSSPGDSTAATKQPSRSAMYGTLSFCRGLCISAFCNSFLCTVRHLRTKKKKKSRVRHQTTENVFSEPYYLSFLLPLPQIKSYNILFWNWGQGLLIPENSVSHISFHWFSLCLKVNSNSNCISLYSNGWKRHFKHYNLNIKETEIEEKG